MKRSLDFPSSPAAFRTARGSALIAVLAIIVLLGALVTIFLVRTGTERSASASYDAAASTRLLAESAVNLVQATINEATTGTGSSTWASQPGAVRVFDDAGNLTKIYRLYSSTTMSTATSSGSILANDIPPVNWASQPAVWVDLNKPVTISGFGNTKSLSFPILDPRDPKSPGSATNPSVLSTLDGFSISGAPGATQLQPAPMPVRWMYMLRDGTMVTPSSPSGSTVTISGATKENPIVGRVAFWTDDETTKVNVNTASGSIGKWNGTAALAAPWDVPRFRMLDDVNLFSRNQPVQGEYQRYPGHPATTDLSKIFTALGMPIGDYPNTQTAAATSSSFFSLLPRYDDQYGSKGGTVDTTKSNTPTTITAKNDRLYTSPGEMLFRPDRTQNPGSGASVTQQQVETGKFLLTSHSRAPETTLFGTPRIAVWPIDSEYGANPTPTNNTKLVTPFDKLIAFCSSTGIGSAIKQYYIQRHDSTSPTNDWSQITRNRQLYSYLQSLTGRNIPGFGGTFLQKYSYPNERDQILTEMVDYIRSTNVYDHSVKDASSSNPTVRFTPPITTAVSGGGQVVPLRIGATQGLGRMYTISEVALLLISTADGNGDPSNEYDPRTRSNNITDKPNPTLADTYDGTKILLNPGEKRLQAMILIELNSPMLGFDTMMPDVSINIRDLNNVKFTTSAGLVKSPFPSGDLLTEGPATRYNDIIQMGGLNGFQYFMSRVDWNGTNYRRNGWSNSSTSYLPYRFVSNPFTVPTAADGSGTVTLSTSGNFVAEIMVKAKGTSTRRVVQTFQISFPSITLPLPDLIQTTTAGSNTMGDWWGFDKRIEWAPQSPGSTTAAGKGAVIRTDATGIPDSSTAGGYRSDVVRSLAAKDGDVRLIMAKETVTADGTKDMVTTPGYSSGAKLAHTLMQAKASNLVPGVNLSGKLVSGADYEPAWTPKVPSTSTPAADWDWDTGLPGSRDGAYANKPDEGNIYTSSGAAPYYNGEQQSNSTSSSVASYFTANRIIPSPVMFGSLPTGVQEGVPWRTLLFRPQASRPRDPSGPKDHLLLDLFTMPVVEPYAISEPFSTAGKVNMNYQIVPFTYIDRSTGVRAVLGSELMARVPKAAAQKNGNQTGHNYYKMPFGSVPGANAQPPSGPALGRLPLNLSDSNGSLRQFKEKFAQWDIFRSPSEICDIYLVPQGYSWASNSVADAGWYGDDFALVGDNVRERPYADIYPRLTTKSNTFTVHYTVQALKNPPANAPDKWTEGKGQVVGELRGSVTLERFLDPANTNIPDYAANPSAPNLDNYYQWRVLENSTFSP
ncbi:Verru_Chthon cassette protein A [Terrimicrobium sacchariphilum]|uniref:Verru_Chthon cassette protein A n=1 Tax=Terrimicrobium sacchariphilum TaxID=690879 RepID=A0A146GDF5_TERSA|nr:Verru_Chthon cassette protein A [Terrimicrobium sacchariphilum]GAT34677.1 Verru_Chthon cassette protein A [Terrimicrobium sacchariphilum]